MDKTKNELIIKIKEYVYAQRNYLELYLDPEGCTTCGEIWEAEGKMKAREVELWAFLEALTIYRKEA